MADYIKREDAIRACISPFDMERIEIIPAADVVEVVRCKDCEYADFLVESDPTCICTRIGEHCAKREKDFFCAYGERRTDNE